MSEDTSKKMRTVIYHVAHYPSILRASDRERILNAPTDLDVVKLIDGRVATGWFNAPKANELGLVDSRSVPILLPLQHGSDCRRRESCRVIWMLLVPDRRVIRQKLAAAVCCPQRSDSCGERSSTATWQDLASAVSAALSRPFAFRQRGWLDTPEYVPGHFNSIRGFRFMLPRAHGETILCLKSSRRLYHERHTPFGPSPKPRLQTPTTHNVSCCRMVSREGWNPPLEHSEVLQRDQTGGVPNPCDSSAPRRRHTTLVASDSLSTSCHSSENND